jgi:uncharacterized protein YjbI with pentapeptide repeats
MGATRAAPTRPLDPVTVLAHNTLSTAANLTEADLSEALLRGASMTVANLKGAVLENTRLIGVVGLPTATQNDQASKN